MSAEEVRRELRRLGIVLGAERVLGLPEYGTIRAAFREVPEFVDVGFYPVPSSELIPFLRKIRRVTRRAVRELARRRELDWKRLDRCLVPWDKEDRSFMKNICFVAPCPE